MSKYTEKDLKEILVDLAEIREKIEVCKGSHKYNDNGTIQDIGLLLTLQGYTKILVVLDNCIEFLCECSLDKDGKLQLDKGDNKE